MRGTRVQHNPKSSSCQTHGVDPTVTRGKQQGLPREIRPTPRKGKASRKAYLAGGGSQQRA
jgi:hypothetical protein